MDHIEYFKTLGAIDLISEKHKQLRLATMAVISEQFDNKFSEMEIYLISLTFYQSMSVSEAARYMNISRQAAHKHVQHLLTLGYIQLATSESNRRDKIISLTESGVQLSEKLNKIKAELDSQLEVLIGEKDYRYIKALFKKDWQLS